MQSPIVAFLESVSIGVLATQRRDGTIRQSAVYFLLDPDLDRDVVFISTERPRAKAQDIGRTGHASLCVVGRTPPYPSVTVEGRARILDSEIAQTTARIFARMTGGSPPALTDDELAARGRVLVRLDVDRVYGASYLPDATKQ